MRFVPLISAAADPTPWSGLAPLLVRWDAPHPAWRGLLTRGLAVHAVLLSQANPVEEGLEVLRLGFGPDFLILPVSRPATREAGFRLLGQLEILLEATSGRGVKVALCLEGEAEAPVLELLREARGEAVGFCWHPGTRDAEALSDRLWCGLCSSDSDLRGLQALGYRWDMALEASDPATFAAQATRMRDIHPEVLFPAQMPTTALGRPVVPDDSLVFGRHWDPEGRA